MPTENSIAKFWFPGQKPRDIRSRKILKRIITDIIEKAHANKIAWGMEMAKVEKAKVKKVKDDV